MAVSGGSTVIPFFNCSSNLPQPCKTLKMANVIGKVFFGLSKLLGIRETGRNQSGKD